MFLQVEFNSFGNCDNILRKAARCVGISLPSAASDSAKGLVLESVRFSSLFAANALTSNFSRFKRWETLSSEFL